MKRIVLLLLVMPLFSISQTKESTWSLSLEPMLYRNMETLILAKKNKALGMLFKGEWNKATISGIHRAGLAFIYARPKNEFEPANVTLAMNVDLKYSYLIKLKSVEKAGLYLGGMAQADYKLAYYALWDDSHMYWADFWGIGFSSWLEKPLKERSGFIASFELPVFGLASRPPLRRDYKIDDQSFGGIMEMAHQDLKVVSPVSYFNPVLKFGIRLKYSDKFSTDFYYHFEYLNADISYSDEYKQLQHGLGINLIF